MGVTEHSVCAMIDGNPCRPVRRMQGGGRHACLVPEGDAASRVAWGRRNEFHVHARLGVQPAHRRPYQPAGWLGACAGVSVAGEAPG